MTLWLITEKSNPWKLRHMKTEHYKARWQKWLIIVSRSFKTSSLKLLWNQLSWKLSKGERTWAFSVQMYLWWQMYFQQWNTSPLYKLCKSRKAALIHFQFCKTILLWQEISYSQNIQSERDSLWKLWGRGKGGLGQNQTFLKLLTLESLLRLFSTLKS